MRMIDVIAKRYSQSPSAVAKLSADELAFCIACAQAGIDAES